MEKYEPIEVVSNLETVITYLKTNLIEMEKILNTIKKVKEFNELCNLMRHNDMALRMVVIVKEMLERDWRTYG